MTVRSLADLGQGARGRIVELRLPPGRRTLAADAAALDAAAFRARYRLPP